MYSYRMCMFYSRSDIQRTHEKITPSRIMQSK